MNDTLIVLVLAGLALIFKWLTRQVSDDSEKSEPPSPNEQTRPSRQPPQSEEERIRRFLEALGAPPGTRPPPPVRPRRVVTPATRPAQGPQAKRSWAQPLPPLVTTPKDLGPPPSTPASFEPVMTEAAASPVISVPVPQIVTPSAPPPLPPVTASRRPTPPQSLGTLLRSRASVRQAVILREVLGPPRGLQAFEE